MVITIGYASRNLHIFTYKLVGGLPLFPEILVFLDGRLMMLWGHSVMFDSITFERKENREENKREKK